MEGSWKAEHVAHREVALVHQPRQHVAVLDREVVMRAEDVRRHDGREVAAVLLVVAPAEHVDHPLGVRIPFVGGVRRAVVDHALVDRVRRLVGEDASGEARDQLAHAKLLGAVEHLCT